MSTIYQASSHNHGHLLTATNPSHTHTIVATTATTATTSVPWVYRDPFEAAAIKIIRMVAPEFALEQQMMDKPLKETVEYAGVRAMLQAAGTSDCLNEIWEPDETLSALVRRLCQIV